ncbi:MAG: hypothetical protein HYX79_11025 [Chloroflexi bacterium]|nr:hypothetical protein [Chloroflexota bacterium]
MKKKSGGKDHEFLMDGKPASLLAIAESSGDDAVWKSVLERAGQYRKATADHYLKAKLGEYLSASEIHSITKIKTSVLDKWRERGLLRAEQLRGRWYYSIKDLLAAIKSANVGDIKS